MPIIINKLIRVKRISIFDACVSPTDVYYRDTNKNFERMTINKLTELARSGINISTTNNNLYVNNK